MRVFWTWNGSPETELAFVKRTDNFLIVRYPDNSVKAGQPWRIGQRTVEQWQKLGVLRIEA